MTGKKQTVAFVHLLTSYLTSSWSVLCPHSYSPTALTLFILQNLHLNSVTAVLLVDSDGNRLLAKYYQPSHSDPKQPNAFKHPFQSIKEQRTFEAGLWEKTRRANGELSPRVVARRSLRVG